MATSHFLRQLLPPARTFYERELGELGRPSRGWARPKAGCPFHPSKSKTSFWVHLDSGGFNCFGCGAKGGDVLAFIRMRDHLSFKEAAQRLNAYDEAPSPETVRALAAQTRDRDRQREQAAALAELDRRRRLAIREQLHACSWAYGLVGDRLTQLRQGADPDWPDEEEACWLTLQLTLGDLRKLDAEYCAADGLECEWVTEKTNGVALSFDGSIYTPSSAPIRQFDQIPDIMTMEIPPINYLVDGMVARKTITLWTGSDGTAKTFLLQKMAVAVATGGQFLGRRCQSAPVLYLDYENPSFAVRDRLDLMAGGQIDGLKVWGTWLEQQPPQICNELLLTIAKETKPLIFVDPFRYAHGAEENDSTEMMGVMQMLRYCAAAGGAVVIAHHPAKAEGSMGRGSTAIKGAVDVAFLQELSDESGLITLKCTKNRFGDRMTVTIRPDYDEGTFEVTDSPAFTKRTEECERLLQIITETPGLSQNLWWKKSGMMKARFVALVKANNGRLWQEEKAGSSLRYFSLVLKTQNNPENNRTGQGVQGCSPVLSLYRENREQPVLDLTSCSRTGDGKGVAKKQGAEGEDLPEKLEVEL